MSVVGAGRAAIFMNLIPFLVIGLSCSSSWASACTGITSSALTAAIGGGGAGRTAK